MAAIAGAAVLLGLAALAPGMGGGVDLEVIATGVARPLQLAFDGRGLIVLSPGQRGDTAGEIYRVDLAGELPVDLSGQPRVTIPFTDSRSATFGSLVFDPDTRAVYLGEENGTRIHRLGPDGRLALYATGIHRLAGGSTLAFDTSGRLIVVDHVDPALSESEEWPPPGLEQLREEDYRGPLVFRLTLDPSIPLPRRLGRLAPLFPRAWGGKAGGAFLPRLISVAPVGTGELVFLTSSGELYRLDAAGGFGVLARLPRGQYNRTHMVAAPDGSVIVSGGFHIGRIFRVGLDGAVTLLAANLADPEGIALDGRGRIYVAESSFHRIIRLGR
jgi:streptogramin lyase